MEEWCGSGGLAPVGRQTGATVGRAEVGRGVKRQVRRALHAAGYELSRYGRRVSPDEPEMWARNKRDERLLVTTMAACIHEDSNCVDVGSYRGHVIEQMARLAPKGHHLAFEPIPWCATALRGRFPNVEVRDAVVDAKSRELRIGEGADPLSVSVVSLDDAVDGARVDFLRIDVEDAELRVFQGATETLRRWRPVVVFEHCREQYDVGTTEELGARESARNEGIYDLLVDDLDYRIFDLEGAGPLDREEFRAGYASMRRFHFLAVPARREDRAVEHDPSVPSEL